MGEPEIVYKSKSGDKAVNNPTQPQSKPANSEKAVKDAPKNKAESKPQLPPTNVVLEKPKAMAKAKSAKITLVLDPTSITRVETTGVKQTTLKILVDNMEFEADINSKSYRKTLASIDELGVENCSVILQGTMKIQVNIENAGLAVQPKKAKEESQKEVTQEG